MAYDRASLKYDMYIRLNKAPETRGFYSDEKANSAIQESLDFVSTSMFIADEGWLKQIDFLDVTPSAVTINIPAHMAMIGEVRYLVGNVYLPLAYDTEAGMTQIASSSGMVQFPNSYKIVDNRLYFNPPLSVGGTGYLQIEYFAYPKILRQDTDKLPRQFDRCMSWFIVYNSMTIMASSLGQFAKSWQAEADKWATMCQAILDKRNMQSIAIRDFEG